MGQGSTIYLLTAICILQLLGFAANGKLQFNMHALAGKFEPQPHLWY